MHFEKLPNFLKCVLKNKQRDTKKTNNGNQGRIKGRKRFFHLWSKSKVENGFFICGQNQR